MTGTVFDWLYLAAISFVGSIALVVIITEAKNDRRCPYCGKRLEIDDVAQDRGYTVCRACALRNWRGGVS